MKLILRALDRVEQARDCQDVGQGAFCVMTPMWKGVLTPVDRIISGDQYVHATATLLLPTNTPPRSSSPAPLGALPPYPGTDGPVINAQRIVRVVNSGKSVSNLPRFCHRHGTKIVVQSAESRVLTIILLND
jgi:hypothetical protein